MTKTNLTRLCPASLLLLISFNGWAADPVDAGRLLREQPKQPPKLFTPPSVEIPKEAIEQPADVSGATVLVNGFQFEGVTLIPEKELQEALSSFVGKRLSFSELQQLTNKVTAYYAEKGYMARAILPPQEVNNGVILIKVIEGKLGKVTIDNKGERTDSEKIQAFIAYRMAQEDVMDLAQFGEALKIINDQPGVSVSSRLSSGNDEGAVDVFVISEDKPLATFNASISNEGSRSTGEIQAVTSLTLNNPTGAFDSANLMFTKTQGSEYALAGYNRALGYSGLRVGGSLSRLDYEINQSGLGGADASGSAKTYSLNASFPIYRRKQYSLGVSADANLKDLEDYTSVGETGDRSVTTATVGANGSLQDSWNHGGLSSFSLGLTHGKSDQSNQSALDQDEVTREAFGSFTKLSYTLSRQQNLFPGWTLDANLRGQFAFNNLDSSERFSLGGVSGVRAYPSGEGGGDEGHLLSLNLVKQFSGSVFGTVFLDAGYIKDNHDTWDNWNAADPDQKNSYHLSGVGSAINWNIDQNVSFSASLATPLGNNPRRDAEDRNSDGRHRNVQGWISLVAQF